LRITDIDINTNQALDINGTIYNGAFEIFYGYKNINGNLVSSRETGYISDMYSSTDDGFGNGLYIEENTNDQELKYIYDKLVKILEENELV